MATMMSIKAWVIGGSTSFCFGLFQALSFSALAVWSVKAASKAEVTRLKVAERSVGVVIER